MDYRKLFEEINESVQERYDLVMDRIAGLAQEESVANPYRSYFAQMAAFITRMRELYEQFDAAARTGGTLAPAGPMPETGKVFANESFRSDQGAAAVSMEDDPAAPVQGKAAKPSQDGLRSDTRFGSYIETLDLAQREALNYELYAQVLPEKYETSYANPAYAVRVLGEDYGQLLSYLCTQLRNMIVYVYEGRKLQMTITAELFMEIYCCFEADERPAYSTLQQAVYWYVSDYCDLTIEDFTAEQFDDERSFLKDIILRADLSDEGYLYLYGEYISEDERRTARFLASLPEKDICVMADAFVDGFVRGYQVMRMDLSAKDHVCIRTAIGFERVIRESIRRFESMGLRVHLFRSPAESAVKKSARYGFIGTSPNPQYEYDHAQDQALFLDKAFNARRLEVLRGSCEKRRHKLMAYGGPAVMEVFGEEPFTPVRKPEVLKLSARQQEFSVAYASKSAQLLSEYIDENHTSFTIIAWPLPSIGPAYEEIFWETIRLNTLDNTLYTRIQQRMIDVLDQADACIVEGRAGINHTHMRVQLWRIEDASAQTKFENCVADVNIPAGEVFTSPVLAGTNGVIHVSSVYLNGYQFKDLEITLHEGMVADYTCRNFESKEENQAYIKENILMNHETLPLGEFAIGTNTTAYRMARKYGIIQKLPILIVEKTGPHFALGDTCYSRAEDHKVYNPDGKEIVARENEISALRAAKPQEAYFNCHTDITIPYDEIGRIAAVRSDGQEIPIIENGRFVLEGTQELNKPLAEDV